MLVYAPRFLIHKHLLTGLHQIRLSIVAIVEITHKLVGIEIVFLNAERTRNLAFIIHVSVVEHLFAIEVFNNIPRLVNQETLRVCLFACLIVMFSIVICRWYNNIAVGVVVDVSKNIVDVESSKICIWWAINDLLLLELFK